MDIKEQYEELTEKLRKNLPLKAYPARGLTQIIRNDGHPVTLKSELSVTNVFNSGDISGIMCTVKAEDGYKLACALTHLVFPGTTPHYLEIIEYQKKREKRIKKLNQIGNN